MPSPSTPPGAATAPTADASPPPPPATVAPLWDEGWTTSAAHWPSPASPGLPGAAPAAGVRPPISDALLRAIVDGNTPDAWVNDILWALLGYRRLPKSRRPGEADEQEEVDEEEEEEGASAGDVDSAKDGSGGGGNNDEWDTSAVADVMVVAGHGDAPPDFIGRPGATTAAADRPVKRAIQALNRSVPPAGKQLLKSRLGFRGYKVGEMTPNRTRRATAVNWVLWWLAQHGLDTEADGGGSWAQKGQPKGGGEGETPA